MPSKTSVNVPSVASEKETAMAGAKAKKDETFSVAEVDPLTPEHLKEGSDEPRYGVTVDEGPVPTVDADGKRAIESVREAEKSEAEKMAYRKDDGK